MNDTELLKHLLGHMYVTELGDLNWPYADCITGLEQTGECSEVVDALVKRRAELCG